MTHFWPGTFEEKPIGVQGNVFFFYLWTLIHEVVMV
jgi:hypothetical protein